MTPTILGLDIGGANLKAATSDKRAVSVPFPLWKQPDRLPAALAGLIAPFSDADEIAVTMTGELCDCFETKREGVNRILDAVAAAAGRRPVRVWATDDRFLNPEEAKADHLKVAAANWHALATFAGRFAPTHGGLLIDIGSTTSDLIPLAHGLPYTWGTTDPQRLKFGELVYAGVRRTPVMALFGPHEVAAEYFASTLDVFLVLGEIADAPHDTDTADGRPATRAFALPRLARMLCGDLECVSEADITWLAAEARRRLVERLVSSARSAYGDQWITPELRVVVVSGSGEFLGREVAASVSPWLEEDHIVSLSAELGPGLSACAPAYAVAVLAQERRP